MSGFGFSEEQERLREEVKRFAQRELAPGALARAKMGPEELHENMKDIDKKIVELGWTRINVPEKYGGYPLGHVEIGIIHEEVHKVDPTVEAVGGMEATSALLQTLPEILRGFQRYLAGKIINCEEDRPRPLPTRNGFVLPGIVNIEGVLRSG